MGKLKLKKCVCSTEKVPDFSLDLHHAALFCCAKGHSNDCYCSVADPETSERGGGARNMKYKPPAIFFMTNFYRPDGGHSPIVPPPIPLDPLLIFRPLVENKAK